MGWYLQEIPLLDEGEYDVEITAIKELHGRYGSVVCIEFTLCAEEAWERYQVTGIVNKKLTASSKLGLWIQAILGRMPRVSEDALTQELLNKQCRVGIRHRKSLDGKSTFANVDKVLDPRAPF